VRCKSVFLLPTDAPLDVTSEGGADPQAGIKIKGLIQHFFKVASIQNEAVPMLSQNTLFGTAYMETGSWLVRRGWMTGQDGKRAYQLLESRPDAKWVDFFQIFPHPAKLEMNDGLPLIRRRFVDSEHLKSLMENPYFEHTKLKEALDFIKQIISEDKTLLIVGTKIQIKNLVKELAEEFGLPYVTERWLGGTITNFDIIKK